MEALSPVCDSRRTNNWKFCQASATENLKIGVSDQPLNNPLELDRYLKNWAKADMNVPDYSIKIIKTDEEFDLHMAQLLQDGLQVLANPKFNMQGELLSGIVFRDFNELMLSHNEE